MHAHKTESQVPLTVVAKEPRQTLAQKIYAILKDDIHQFRLVPGDRLYESETALRLGVSRTPLREALLRLQSEGFIGVELQTGWYVKQIDFDYISELYDLRIVLEAESVARLCNSATEPPQLHELKNFWLVPASKRLKDGHIVGQHDERFHSALVEASGNKEMLKVHNHVTERIRIVRQLDFTRDDRIEATYIEHSKILRAIIEKKLNTAQMLLRAHIEASKIEVQSITLHSLHRARSRLKLLEGT